jgi:spore cortex protein
MEKKYNTILSIFVALFIGSVILFGCAKSNNETESNNQEKGQSTENAVNKKDSNSDSILLGKKISQSLQEIEGVEKATVFIKETTALVGIVIKDGSQEVTKEVREKIEQKVKDISPEIRKVAITADKELFESLNSMANDFMNGKTLEELKKDLKEIMEKLGD